MHNCGNVGRNSRRKSLLCQKNETDFKPRSACSRLQSEVLAHLPNTHTTICHPQVLQTVHPHPLLLNLLNEYSSFTPSSHGQKQTPHQLDFHTCSLTFKCKCKDILTHNFIPFMHMHSNHFSSMHPHLESPAMHLHSLTCESSPMTFKECVC